MSGRWLSRIRNRSVIAVGLIMALFGIMFASNYVLTRNSLELLHSSEGRTFPVLQILDRSLTRLKDYQESLQAAVGTNDLYAIEDAHTIGAEIHGLLEKVESLDPSLRERVDPILKQLNDYTASAEELTRRVIAREITFSGENPQIKSYFALQEATFQRINGFRSEIHSFYTQQIRQTSESGETTISRGAILIVISLAMALGILVFLQRSIIQPILLLAQASRKVAQGTFSRVPERQGQDEVSQLTNDFNHMISALELSSQTMSSIIEHGRRIAVSPSLARLRLALQDGLTAFSQKPFAHEFWVSLRTLVRGESAEDRFILVSADGGLSSETCTLAELQKRPHIPVHNHLDDATMALIIPASDDDFAQSPVKNFLEAVAIHVASALDSIKLQDAMKLVKEQSQSMRTLLENIDQGICTIDAQLQIRGPYSPFLETLVGRQNLEAVNFFEAVVRRSTLNTEQKSILANILRVCFGEDSVAYELNRHQLVRELEWWKDGCKMICEIDWLPLASRDGVTERFMIVLRDVTHVRLLQKEAEAHMQKLKLIDALLQVDAHRFALVTRECQKTLESMQEAMHAQDRALPFWQETRRNLHTEKGNLRALGLSSLSTCLHELEDAIESYLVMPVHDSAHEVQHLTHQLDVALGELRMLHELFYETLKRGPGHQTGGASAQEQELMSWLDRIQDLPTEQLMRELESFRERACQNSSYGSHALVRSLEAAAAKLAHDLGQKTPRIVWSGTPLLFRRETYNEILSAFHHMVRNSMDHGFAGSRSAEAPVIQIHAQLVVGGRLQLVYQDNGAGLNLKDLHRKVSKGQSQLVKHDDESLAEFIFSHGISVKDQVTETSGRGIGMDAVRNTCRQLGGSIKVRFTAEAWKGYRAFAFDIDLAVAETLVWPRHAATLQVA